MTETNMNTSNPYDGERRAGTVGFPLPGVELRIMADGGEVAPGEVGMIEVRGPNVFKGYWQMPEKTAEELRADGLFMTGDLGRLRCRWLCPDRRAAKDLVISGGFNVYPKEVELLLDEVPGVLESAVIGLPHPDFGEAVFAVLVAAPGRGAGPGCGAGRDPRPAGTLQAAQGGGGGGRDLPRNTMGKVQKNLLRQTYSGWFAG